jgi:restriction system protein
MEIPTYQEFMLPVLKALGETPDPLHHKDYCERACDIAGIPQEMREILLPSGSQTYVYNRTGWAAWYMQQAGLVMKPKRAFLTITEEGKKLLQTQPSALDNKLLAQYPSFVDKVLKPKNEKTPSKTSSSQSEQTPDEQIEAAFEQLNDSLSADLLEAMGKMDPFRFEHLVVDLLFSMGYGGSREEAAKVTKKSNDEGIDGVINEDRLGLDVIYVQAKRWQNTVGRKEIQSFVGALAGKQANKGVFITTSDFSQTATDYADLVTQKVVLIDGNRLANLMIEHGIGVSTTRMIVLKRIDSDYFEES